MRWRQFCAELLAACDDLGGELVVTLGALLADTPHTRPIPVTGTATEPELVDRLKLEQSTYEGPTGIVGVFQDACVRLDIPAVSYWAAVPHYVAQPPCPKATLALLGQLEDLLEVSIPLGDLPEDARAWERGVDELAEEDEDIADYVRALEETRDTAELPEASGEAIAREFERYLKRREDELTPTDRAVHARQSRQAQPDARPQRCRRGHTARQSPAYGSEREAEGGVEERGGSWTPHRGRRSRPGRRCRGSRRPSLDRGDRGGASRSSASAASTALDDRCGVGARRRGASARRHWSSVSTAVPELGVGPLPVAAVVVAQQRQPDRHRVDAAVAAARRRRPGCPATSTSSRRRRPTIPAWT